MFPGVFTVTSMKGNIRSRDYFMLPWLYEANGANELDDGLIWSASSRQVVN